MISSGFWDEQKTTNFLIGKENFQPENRFCQNVKGPDSGSAKRGFYKTHFEQKYWVQLPFNLKQRERDKQ